MADIDSDNIEIIKGSDTLPIESPEGTTFLGYKTIEGIETSVQIDFENMTPLFGVSNNKGQSTTLVPSQKVWTDNNPEVITSKNKFDKNKILIGWYQPGSVTNIQQAAGWICTDYIPAEANTIYTLSGAKDRVGIGFYNANKNCIGYLGINTGTFTTPANTVYIIFNLASPTQSYWSLVQLEPGDTATGYMAFNQVLLDSIEKGSDIVKSIDNSLISKRVSDHFIDIMNLNLINPYQVKPGYIVSPYNGNIEANNNYAYTGYIDVDLLTTYTGMNLLSSNIFRSAAYFNEQKVFISGNIDPLSSFIPASGTKYVRLNLYRLSGDDYSSYGLFKGTSPTFSSYDNRLEFKDKIQTPKKNMNEAASVNDIYNITSGNSTELSFSITNSGNNIVFKYDIGTITGLIKENRGYNGNNMFNFSNFNIFSNSINNGDDVAPMHIMSTTMGANHAQPVSIATIAGHGKTNADIGSEWLDSTGTKFYIMRIVDADKIAFLSENRGTREDFNFKTLSIGTLTKETQTLVITSIASSQLFPSVKNVSLKVLRNGLDEVSKVGDYTAKYVDIVETYDIMNTHDVLENIKARLGSASDPVYDGQPMVTVQNIYRFLATTTCLVMTNVIPRQNLKFADLMFSQAIPIAANIQSTSLKYYVPNSLPIGSYDFRKPLSVAWSSSIPALFFGSDSWQEANNPPNRVVQIYGTMGFALGFLPYGVGKALQDYTNRTFELRNDTGKIYPHGVEGTKVGTTLSVGDIYSSAMYRTFFPMSSANAGRMFMYNFNYNDSEYIIADYSASMVDNINLNNALLNGKQIEVTESSNCELRGDIYNNGLLVKATYVEGETCFIILRIE